MKKTLLIAGAFLALTASSASAIGVNLFWNDCSPAAGGSGASDQANPCTANTGAFILMASLNPLPGITQCVGMDGVIDLQTSAAVLNPWWQMRAGGCRPTAISSQFAFGALGSCVDPWLGQAFGGMDYAYSGANRARIRAACAQQQSTAGPLDPGAEAYMFQITITKVLSTGTTCPGCLDAACFVLNQIKITQPTGNPAGDPVYTTPDQSQFATYKGGSAMCLATPNQNRTWGSVKALYR